MPGLGKYLAWLLLIFGMVFVVVAAVARERMGEAGLWAAVVTAGACLPGAVLVPVLLRVLDGPMRWMLALTVGMLVRMGFSLAAVVIAFTWFQPIANAGFVVDLLVFYLLTLAIDASLVIWDLKASRRLSGAEDSADGHRKRP